MQEPPRCTYQQISCSRFKSDGYHAAPSLRNIVLLYPVPGGKLEHCMPCTISRKTPILHVSLLISFILLWMPVGSIAVGLVALERLQAPWPGCHARQTGWSSHCCATAPWKLPPCDPPSWTATHPPREHPTAGSCSPCSRSQSHSAPNFSVLPPYPR